MRISDWSSDVCSSDLFFVIFPLPALSSHFTRVCNFALVGAYVGREDVYLDLECLSRNESALQVYSNHTLALHLFRRIHTRSEERRVGKEWVSTGRSRWLQYT